MSNGITPTNGHSPPSLEELKAHARIIAPRCPRLPALAALPADLGADACPWLDYYIAHSRTWSPRSYDDFHEAGGLWVLSTAAARRVMVSLGGKRFTSLYIAQCARTSLWAKSTAARIGSDLLRDAGLAWLLAPDDSTPQAFVASMTARLPQDYGEMPERKQETIRQRLAFAAQRGWYYEEFGQKISAMMRDGGAMADYRGLLRRLDDCPERYETATIGRGNDELERPYLALLASLTPADMAPYARQNGALWNDGFFARFAFVTPPPEAKPLSGKFPEGERTIPAGLIRQLQEWHQRLGVPDVQVVERTNDKGTGTGAYDLYIEPVEPKRATLGEGVYDAFYRYSDALRTILITSDNQDLDGSYTRFPEKAMRVALLLASVSGSDVIEMRHWARAQQITERWRANLHNLIAQLQNTAEVSRESELEDKVVRALGELGEASVRDIRSTHLRSYSSEELTKVLSTLVQNGIIASIATPRTTKYCLAGEE